MARMPGKRDRGDRRKANFRSELTKQSNNVKQVMGTLKRDPNNPNILTSPHGMDKDELNQFAQEMGERILLKKRDQPHLSDLILDGKLTPDTAAPPPLSTLYNAHKFVFDTGASIFVGDMVRTSQDIMLSQHEWARPPYDVCWLEMNHLAYFEHGLQMESDYSRGPPDALYGMLIDHGKVWVFSHTEGQPPRTGLAPFIYQLNMPVSEEDEAKMAAYFDVPVQLYRASMLGGGIAGMRERGGFQIRPHDADLDRLRTEVTRSHKRIINPGYQALFDRASMADRQNMLLSCSGDLKLIIVLLLLLTRPKKVFDIIEEAPKRFLWKGKNVLRRRHSVISMSLARDKAVKRVLHHIETGGHRQAHPVHGHWAHQRKHDRSCTHQWEPLDKPRLQRPDRYYCVNCHAKRWWVKDHRRGDPKLGGKTTEYKVTE